MLSALKKLRPKKLNCNYINESNKESLNYVLDPTTLIFSPKSSLYPKKICKLSPKTHLFQNINNLDKTDFLFNDNKIKKKPNYIKELKISLNLKKSSSTNNILKQNPFYKYLNKKELNNLTKDNLHIGFLSSNPKILIRDIHKKNNSTSNIKKLKKTNTFKSRRLSRLVNFINDKVKENKMLIVNVNKTKKKKLLGFEDSSIITKEMSKEEENKEIGLNKNNLVDRFILKLIDPDEIMEDYLQDKGKPFDRYTKFKKQAVKEKNRVGRLLDYLTKSD
jgi:hypothetical protein